MMLLTAHSLGRLRPLELLELWHRLHPDGRDATFLPGLTGDQLAALLLPPRQPRP